MLSQVKNLKLFADDTNLFVYDPDACIHYASYRANQWWVKVFWSMAPGSKYNYVRKTYLKYKYKLLHPKSI